MSDIPHFSFPFSFSGLNVHAREVEQDSVDDIASCVAAILLTRVGQYPDTPEFGTDDPAFIEGGIDPDEMIRLIEFWEPRIVAAVEEGWDFDDYLQNIRLSIQEEVKHG